MDLTLTDEQQLIASTAREVLASREWASDADGYSTELWKEMVSLGWMGLALPEEHGGIGQSFLECCLVIEQLGGACVPSPFVPTVVGGAMAIARFGSDHQKAAWIEPIAAGERKMSFGHLGPSGSWDVPDVVSEPTGGGRVLEGALCFVPFAHVADGLVVVARHRGGEPVVAIVDAEDAELEALETVHPDRPHRVRLAGAKAEALGGAEAARGALELCTAAACAEMVGGAQHVLDATVEHAKERQQFGRPIGSFQAVQHHCANMAIDVLSARFIAYEAIWRLSEGLQAAEEVAVAKAWTSEAYARVCALGHQVHGAIGFTEEHGLHRYLRHAVALELAHGDTEHHLERVARHLGI
jgi:3-oxocholest-4-en-26-oyl-CoA dehydrogenase beta subunit